MIFRAFTNAVADYQSIVAADAVACELSAWDLHMRPMTALSISEPLGFSFRVLMAYQTLLSEGAPVPVP